MPLAFEADRPMLRGMAGVAEAKICLLPEELVMLAREVIEANRKLGRRIVVAESCTGGLVSAALTEIPGSSAVFEAGFVTYSNAQKISLLGVSEDVLDTFGAVSIATAWAMAQGALNRSGADIAVSITGVAVLTAERSSSRSAPSSSPEPNAATKARMWWRTCDGSRTKAARRSGFTPRCARSNCCCRRRWANKALRRALRKRRSSCAGPGRRPGQPASRTCGS